MKQKAKRTVSRNEQLLFCGFGLLVALVAWWDATKTYTYAPLETPPPGSVYPVPSDLLQAFLYAAAITFLRYQILDRFLFASMSSSVPKPSDRLKFRESVWKLFVYSVFIAMGYDTISGEEYVQNRLFLWDGYPSHPMPAKTATFYLVELGYNLHMLVTVFIEVRRKDFAEYVIHHFSTVFLILFSYVLGLTRVGVLVLLAHDPSDFFLELAKCVKYLGFSRLPDIIFGAFVLSWIYFRFYAYAYLIAYHDYYNALTMTTGVTPHIPMVHFFGVLLWTLVVLHVYWFFLIVRMALRLLSTGSTGDDVRSDSESDGEATAPHRD